MTKNLQKSDMKYRELRIPHRGILNPERYARSFHLRCYEPSPDLRQFVEHIWVSRWDLHEDTTYAAADILTRPTITLFFTPDKSFIGGITNSRRIFNVRDIGTMAGAKFKPGGFYPFWKHGMVSFVNKNIPLATVFPAVDDVFSKDLLSLPNDQEIVRRIEVLLRSKQPTYENKLEIDLIEKIIVKIESDTSITTVAAVSQLFAISERKLQRLFRGHVGVGIKWVIQRNRLLEAIKWMHLEPKSNWTRIAIDLGYSTQSHFVNEFKKINDQSPSRYMKSIKKD